MEALIEAGKVAAVIVKDLSRFGREHVETSRYLEIIYPTLGVKFVAIQERVDTETGEGTEMMPFHNIFNEWYAAQTSKKVRAVWAMKAANGKRSNFRVPYGYKRDEFDKEKWLVDEPAAGVVRRIYHLCLVYGVRKRWICVFDRWIRTLEAFFVPIKGISAPPYDSSHKAGRYV